MPYPCRNTRIVILADLVVITFYFLLNSHLLLVINLQAQVTSSASLADTNMAQIMTKDAHLSELMACLARANFSHVNVEISDSKISIQMTKTAPKEGAHADADSVLARVKEEPVTEQGETVAADDEAGMSE